MTYRDADHYVYRLLGPRGRVVYVGCTMDLKRRLAEHRGNLNHAAFTKVEAEGPFDYTTARRIERERIEERAGSSNIEWTSRHRRGVAIWRGRAA